MSPEEMERAREAAFATYPSDGPVTRRVLAQAAQQERHTDEMMSRRPGARRAFSHAARNARWDSDEERTEGWPSEEDMPLLLRGLEPRTWQLILFWLYYEGLSKNEIAERLGYSRQHVWRMVPKALAALKEMQQA